MTDTRPLLEALLQLVTLTADGDLIGKRHRTLLVKKGLAIQCNGWNAISRKGIRYLDDLGVIKP